MTAGDQELRSASRADSTDRVITRTIKAHAVMRDMTPFELGRTLGYSAGTWSRRMNHGGWTATEVAKVADYLDVEVADLFAGRVAAGTANPTYPSGAMTDSQSKHPLGLPRQRSGHSDQEGLQLIIGDGPDGSASPSPLCEVIPFPRAASE